MTTVDNAFLAKTSKKLATKFYCEKCDYTTFRKYNYNIHLESMKHKNNDLLVFANKISKNYICKKCSKDFNDRAGLWRHKQKCNKNVHEGLEDSYDPSEKDIIMMLLKDNSELKNMLFEQQNLMMKVIENGTHNTTNNTTHTNSHNKAFNLNFFLNETCKNAMNITDFVDSIKLQLSDLIDVGDSGYVEGLSKIIVKNLNALDETERPVHCTDKKREIIYIKDENEWAKEDENKSKLRKVIQKVADKNIRLLPQFREKYPDYGDYHSKTSDKYNKMVVEAMTVQPDKDEKIIKNISKAILISNKNV